MTAKRASINGRHRKHYKSGSCLTQHSLEETSAETSARWIDYLRRVREHFERERASTSATAVLTRPEYFERRAAPRTTQSIFGRVMSRMLGLLGRAKMA